MGNKGTKSGGRQLRPGIWYPFYRDMFRSKAYQYLPARADCILLGLGILYSQYMRSSKKGNPDRLTLIPRELGSKFGHEDTFYAAREDTVFFGFFDVVEKSKAGQSKTIYCVSERWKNISIQIEQCEKAGMSRKEIIQHVREDCDSEPSGQRTLFSQDACETVRSGQGLLDELLYGINPKN